MRKTIDTNVLVRALVEEDSEQSRIASSIVAYQKVHVPVTVMLETEWVLRGSYKIDRMSICDAFSSLMALQNVEIDQSEAVGAAILLHRDGFDFADALHLQAARGYDVFLTFDQKLISRANSRGSMIEVEKPN